MLIKRLIGNSNYLKKKEDAEKCISKIIKLASFDNLKNPRFEKTIRHRENLGLRVRIQALLYRRTRHDDTRQTCLLGSESR